MFGSRLVWKIFSFAVLAALLGTQGHGQTTTGSILGTVSDETGGIVPGAAVTVFNSDTGGTRSMETDAQGRYRATNLTLGGYEVSVALAGFRTSVRSGITLTVGAEVVVDLTLSIGAVSERVEVTAEAPLVQTTGSTVSGLVDTQQIQDLPLNGRSFEGLALLQDGVTPFYRGTQSTESGAGFKFSVSGSRANANSFLLDGTIINDAQNFSPGSAANVMLGVETLREFRVLTSTYSAEYGRHMGGVVNAVTKSGTNAFHGNLFYFHRNDNLDANNFFLNKGNQPKPEFKRNQFGASGGGPIVTDRTHFFTGFEGLRERKGFVATGRVPIASARNGLVYNADGVLTDIGVDPAIQPYINLFPVPNGPQLTPTSNVADHFTAPGKPTNEDFFVIKLDHRFGDNHSMFGRYTISDSDTSDPNNNHVHTLNRIARNQYVTVEETSAFSPTVVNVVRASVARSFSDSINTLLFDNSDALKFLPAQQFGEIVFAQDSVEDFGNVTSQPQLWGRTVWQLSDDVTFFKGGHTFKAGFMFDRIQENTTKHRQFGGGWEFNSVASFLANEPLEFSFPPAFNDPHRGWRQSIFGAYIQDDFQLRPNLTLNWGLRWEMATVPTEQHGRLANYPDPVNDFADAPHIGNPWYDGGEKDFGPRLGFAWDPSSNGTTSIRGGFGVYFDHISGLPYNRATARVFPFHGSATFDDEDVLAGQFPRLDLSLTSEPDPFRFTNYSLAPQMKDPTKVNWTFSVQREVARETVVTATYSGSQSSHLPARTNGNSAPVEFDSAGQPFIRHANFRGRGIEAPRSNAQRVNPNLGQLSVYIFNSGLSNYHGLQLGLRRRLAQGFQAQLSYTWSKAMSTSDGALGRTVDSLSGVDASMIPYDLSTDTGLSLFDMRNSFTANFTYELPFGQGTTGLSRAVVAGWSLRSIVSLQDGMPMNIRLRFDRTRSRVSGGGRTDRPNLRPGASNNPILDSRDPDAYYDPNVFTLAPIVTSEDGTFARAYFGNLARNSVIAPGFVNFDFSIVKNTSISETTNLQFRAEFFNLFNRANFGLPDPYPFRNNSGAINPSSGRITRTVNDPRDIQFGLKYIF